MKLTYRPEIDGLRAIAVVAVILYHAQINIFGHQPFKGGFIGVDIFFVISGYLITSIIYKELVTTGAFSFKHFYERRVRRILPALLFVMLVSLPLAWMYLLPDSFVDFSKSILYSLGFSSNFYFHYSGQIYGATDGLFKPFLHTWSLSVEEQYYILFPIVLLITYKFFRRYLIHILTFGFIISLGLAEWTSRNYPSISFYFIHTRMWELLAGSILAYFEITKGHRSKNQLLNITLPIIGLVLISHSIIFFDNDIFHPSFFTLSPIIGVCLIIWFSNKDELITKLLSTKLFVGIGLISYSLYLWHYPIFAFARITDFTQGSLFNKLLLGIIIVILSTLSYYFIERPARNKKYNFNFIIKFLSITILLIFTFNLVGIFNNGYKKRNFPKIIINASKNLDYRNNYQNKIKCHDRKGDNGFCIFNELSDNVGDVILLGDSQTDAILSNLIERISNTKLRLISMSYSGNIYLPNFTKIKKKTQTIVSDETWHKYRTDFLNNKTHKNTYIIIYGRYDSYFEKNLRLNRNNQLERVEGKSEIIFLPRDMINLDYEDRKEFIKNKFITTIEDLSEDKKVILLYPSPVSSDRVLQRIFKNKNKIYKNTNFYLDDVVNYSLEFHRSYFFEEIELINNLNSKNIYKINLEKIFCPENQCFLYDKNNVYIFDTHHPTHEASKKINDLILKEIEKIELKSN
jgi:peptidoglycan/LPS O-acetylase OafA/YrhL